MIAERTLITRPDYIAKYANAQSLERIQEHKKQCVQLQQKGNLKGLFVEINHLYHRVIKNGKKNNLADNVCLAITEVSYFDPATAILYTIEHAPIEKSCKELEHLRFELLDQALQKNLTLHAEIKELLIEQYGFDVLCAARNCYMSRNDHIDITKEYPIIPDDLKSILLMIQQQCLPIAHAELMHLKKQSAEKFASHDIIDPVAQKKVLLENFNCDIIELADNIYRGKLQHKALVSYHNPCDIQNTIINILNNHEYNYESLAQEFDKLSQNILQNASLCCLDDSKVKIDVYNALEAIKSSRNNTDFVINVRLINQLLNDMQNKVYSILHGNITVLKQSPELLTQAAESFIARLNQAT